MRVEDRPSPNHDARPPDARLGYVVLHYTGMESGNAALARLRDPQAEVSAHYVVTEGGRVLRLVPEERRAWHAGVGGWAGTDGLNAVSIGIELVNPGHDWGLKDFAPRQIAALLGLLGAICDRHGLGPEAVLGHSDVAPARKDDPGERFPWRSLAANGFGLWPGPAAPATPDLEGALRALGRIGYRLDLPATTPRHLVRAFQRRFRPGRVDGGLDAETMGLILAAAALPWHPKTAT